MRALIQSNAALLLVGVASFILMGAGQSLYGPALQGFSRSFGISLGTAGLLVSAHWVGCAIGVGAMFLWGSRATPQLVVGAMAVGCGFLGFGGSWALIVTGALIFGAGYGAATVVFNPRMLQAFGPRGPAMLSLLNATFGIGAIGAPLLYVALGNDPARSFLVCGALAALLFLVAGPAGQPSAATTPEDLRGFKLHWPILTFGMCAIGLEACLIGLGPAALVQAGLTETHAAQLLSAFFLAFLAARLALSFTAHLLPPFSLFLIALTGAFLCALVAALWAPGPGFVAMGLFAGAFFPTEYVAASRKMGGHSLVAPTIIAAGLIGGIAAPLTIAPVLDQMGTRGFFWLITAMAGLLTLAAATQLRVMNR